MGNNKVYIVVAIENEPRIIGVYTNESLARKAGDKCGCWWNLIVRRLNVTTDGRGM